MHLKIAEYIAQKAKNNLPVLVGVGEATNADQNKAINEAKQKAFDDLEQQLRGWINRNWETIDKAAQELYDDATKHGSNDKAQKDWEKNWKKHIDALLKKKGWK